MGSQPWPGTTIKSGRWSACFKGFEYMGNFEDISYTQCHKKNQRKLKHLDHIMTNMKLKSRIRRV